MDFRAPTRADADDIVRLLVACDIADYGAPDYDYEALMEEWSEPGVDVAEDGFITDGAYGLLLRTDARAWVHPDLRGGGLEDDLAERLEARARARGHDRLDWQVAVADPAMRLAVEQRGFDYIRSYADLRLSDADVEALPDGDSVRPYDEARDETAVQTLIERAFAHGEAGRIDSLEALKARHADTSLWFVADAPDGSLAGAIRCELRPTGFIEGYVRHLATAPEHRRQGIAGRLIGTAARELVARGSIAIRLHVRSSNPKALELYERLGFRGGWLVDEFRLPLT